MRDDVTQPGERLMPLTGLCRAVLLNESGLSHNDGFATAAAAARDCAAALLFPCANAEPSPPATSPVRQRAPGVADWVPLKKGLGLQSGLPTWAATPPTRRGARSLRKCNNLDVS